MSNDTRLSFELLKLLLQVAWADDQVVDDEREHILSTARRAGVADADLAMLESCLRGEEPLPPPDMGFLRDHRDKAVAAAETLVDVDAGLAAGEADVLAQIREMLG